MSRWDELMQKLDEGWTAEAAEIDDAVTRAPVPEGEELTTLAGLLKPVTEP